VATLQTLNSGVDLKGTNKLVVPNSQRQADELAAGRLGAKRRGQRFDAHKIASAQGRHHCQNLPRRGKLSADELARLNGIGPNVELQAGQEIKLPGSPSTSRQRIDFVS